MTPDEEKRIAEFCGEPDRAGAIADALEAIEADDLGPRLTSEEFRRLREADPDLEDRVTRVIAEAGPEALTEEQRAELVRRIRLHYPSGTAPAKAPKAPKEST